MIGLTYVFSEHPEKGCNKMFQIKGILSIILRLKGLLLVVFLSFAPIKICLAQENITIPLSQIQLIKFEDKDQFDIEKHNGSIFKISLKSFEELSSQGGQVKAEDKIRNRWQLSVKVNYLIPLYEEIDPCLHYNLFFGYSFEKFMITGEIGFSLMRHDQEFASVWGVTTMERSYRFLTFLAHVGYIPFSQVKYFQPYLGIFLGITNLTEYRKNPTAENDQEKIESDNPNLFASGVKVGVDVFPFSRFSVFMEGRVYYHLPKISREIYEARGYFAPTSYTEEYRLMLFTIGGGVKIFF